MALWELGSRLGAGATLRAIALRTSVELVQSSVRGTRTAEDYTGSRFPGSCALPLTSCLPLVLLLEIHSFVIPLPSSGLGVGHL